MTKKKMVDLLERRVSFCADRRSSGLSRRTASYFVFVVVIIVVVVVVVVVVVAVASVVVYCTRALFLLHFFSPLNFFLSFRLPFFAVFFCFTTAFLATFFSALVDRFSKRPTSGPSDRHNTAIDHRHGNPNGFAGRSLTHFAKVEKKYK